MVKILCLLSSKHIKKRMWWPYKRVSSLFKMVFPEPNDSDSEIRMHLKQEEGGCFSQKKMNGQSDQMSTFPVDGEIASCLELFSRLLTVLIIALPLLCTSTRAVSIPPNVASKSSFDIKRGWQGHKTTKNNELAPKEALIAKMIWSERCF